jgi:hypothetical protein
MKPQDLQTLARAALIPPAAKAETMTREQFPRFDKYACTGDTITWKAEGFDLTATLEQDHDTKPTDYDCYDTEDVQRWRDDEWFYVGVVLSVSLNGVELSDHAASLWGVDCNFNDTSNAYLAEVAQELEAEALNTARTEAARIRAALQGVPA